MNFKGVDFDVLSLFVEHWHQHGEAPVSLLSRHQARAVYCFCSVEEDTVAADCTTFPPPDPFVFFEAISLLLFGHTLEVRASATTDLAGSCEELAQRLPIARCPGFQQQLQPISCVWGCTDILLRISTKVYLETRRWRS